MVLWRTIDIREDGGCSRDGAKNSLTDAIVICAFAGDWDGVMDVQDCTSPFFCWSGRFGMMSSYFSVYLYV